MEELGSNATQERSLEVGSKMEELGSGATQERSLEVRSTSNIIRPSSPTSETLQPSTVHPPTSELLLAARIVSMVFTPFYLPMVGLIALFIFSYLNLFPWQYKLSVLVVVYVFTIFMPTFLIHLYRRYQGWSPIELGMKERRVIPYVISILCYFGCYYFLVSVHVSHVIGGIVLVGMAVQILCALINVWWKISTHTAAIGGVAGALVAFSFKFAFNPVWWLCFVLLLAGMVGTARMILRQHSLSEVVVGFVTGFFCAFYMVLRF